MYLFHLLNIQEQNRRFTKKINCPNLKTPYPGAMKFTILKEAFVLFITVYSVYLLNIQKQRRRFMKN